MMEDIETELKSDHIKKTRINAMKPTFYQKKQKDRSQIHRSRNLITICRFLKNMDDLAKSTHLLSDKRDAANKTLDFTSLVRIHGKLSAQQKRRDHEAKKKATMLAMNHLTYKHGENSSLTATLK